MPYNYKFPSDIREDEQDQDEDILLRILGERTQESGSLTVMTPENEYYKKVKYHFKNGKLSGMQYVYNGDGDRVMSVQFVNGKRHGFYVRHHDNGVIACCGTYKEGLPIGMWKFYDHNGEHTSTHKY